ncbi:hypothetical protein PORY_001669 [Pneumocystis oryctolagi]|uniref:Uncharacterized protein n=1 Tax=Pneumocystis oryctolagi TaxID=42067 RepID=A0ACB7CDP8_9ASCO|nr:hypothetical protein PORY_001669 [Pneumocystis oryctolagi]
METFHPGVSILSAPSNTPSGIDTGKWVSVYHWPAAGYAIAPLNDADMKWALHAGIPVTIPSTISSPISPSISAAVPATLSAPFGHDTTISSTDTHDAYAYTTWTSSANHSAAPPAVQAAPTVQTMQAMQAVQTVCTYPPTLTQPASTQPTLTTSLTPSLSSTLSSGWTSFGRKDKPAGHGTVNSGPIPANPLRIYKDANGVDWISFAYSRERIRTEYTIRGDVETVDLDTLSEEFKQQNCIYPRARVPPEQYTGTRHRYETECNSIGWALSKLNPCLRNKRGLIQRAVDSWRNKEPSLRSRRIRRMVALNDLHCIREGDTIRESVNTQNIHNTSLTCVSSNTSPLPPQFRQVASYTVTPDALHTIHELGKKTGKTENTEETMLKRPKYILLDDIKKGARVRVRISLDEVNLEEIPDAFRRDHCVFPRRFVSIHASCREQEAECEQFQTEDVKREQLMNEIGWKLAWLNMRLFANRPSFLQRAVDAYRNKIELVTCEEKWGTRKGRKAWLSKEK